MFGQRHFERGAVGVLSHRCEKISSNPGVRSHCSVQHNFFLGRARRWLLVIRVEVFLFFNEWIKTYLNFGSFSEELVEVGNVDAEAFNVVGLLESLAGSALAFGIVDIHSFLRGLTWGLLVGGSLVGVRDLGHAAALRALFVLAHAAVQAAADAA